MPDPTFIPGHLTVPTLNEQDLTLTVNVSRLNLRRNVMTKPVVGSGSSFALNGQKGGAFSVSGHVTTEKFAAINAAFAVDGAVAFSLQVGKAAGDTDAGLYEGNCVISDFTIEQNADGEWDWSIDAQTTGDVTYTAPSSS